MGDFNQLAYLKHWVPKVEGPVIEIGSKDYGSTASFRDFYAGSEYVGLDMSEGKGVDVIVDLCKGVGTLAEGHFDLGICCSVLEHVDKPWLFARNLSSVIRPGGKLYMSVPHAPVDCGDTGRSRSNVAPSSSEYVSFRVLVFFASKCTYGTTSV